MAALTVTGGTGASGWSSPTPKTSTDAMSGMTPEQVKAWQTTLKGAGYDPGGIDGVWGPNTQAAYNAYKTTGTTPISSAPVEQPKEVKNTDILGGIPGYKSTSPTGLPDMPNVDIPGAYDSAAQKYKDYLDAAYGSQQASTEAQGGEVEATVRCDTKRRIRQFKALCDRQQ